MLYLSSSVCELGRSFVLPIPTLCLDVGLHARAAVTDIMQECGVDLQSWQAQGHDFGSSSAAWPPVISFVLHGGHGQMMQT